MNKNIYIIGALVVAAGVAMFLAALFPSNDQQKEGSTRVASAIIAENASYDFGDIDIFGGKVRTAYTLKNEGLEDITILSGITSCMCTEGEIDDLRFGMHESSGKTITIPAGGEKTLTAVFDPLAHGPDGTGKIKRELLLKTNSSVTPDVTVTFAANVTKDKNQ